MEDDIREAKSIWNNGTISVVLRRGDSKPIRIRVPYSEDNRRWLKNGPRKREPIWNKAGKFWELPKSRFNEIIGMILNRYGKVYIIQPYQEKEVCSLSCINAEGFECQCSCLGANHGSDNHQGWYEITEALAVKYGEEKLGCRLLEKV